ncbi:MAG: hypothetical protein R3C12_11315 [Planctomycetaceae bacterium]|nr:hypothetical protein [Planctomycetaceae bacterium]
MIESLLQQTTIPLLEQVTAFGQKRHQVLAGNIANIDTPDYKTRDLPMQDFERALRLAVQTRRENLQPLPPGTPSQADPEWPALSPGGSLAELWAHPGITNQAALPAMTVKSVSEQFPPSLRTAVEAPSANVTFHDGGNRSIERESMEMTKNASMQSFAIEVMVAQMRMLQTAISGRI